MNTTQRTIAVVAVVALLAAAAVGIGLAYTAETDNTNNDAKQEFWLTAGVKAGQPSGAQDVYQGAYVDGIEYKTKVKPSSVENNYDITYTIVPDVTINDIQGQANVPVAVLGHFPIQVSAPAETDQKPGASGQTYTIQVSFPASAADGRLTFYAQAVKSQWTSSDTPAEAGQGFQQADTNIYKMVKHTVDTVEVYDAYLPVDAEEKFYSIYIGVSSGTGSFVDTVDQLPTTAAKVLNDATVTILADHDSLQNDGTSIIKAAKLTSDKTTITTDATDVLATVSLGQLFFGDTAFVYNATLSSGKYTYTISGANADNVQIDQDGKITVISGKTLTAGTIVVTATFQDTGASEASAVTAQVTITVATPTP